MADGYYLTGNGTSVQLKMLEQTPEEIRVLITWYRPKGAVVLNEYSLAPEAELPWVPDDSVEPI